MATDLRATLVVLLPRLRRFGIALSGSANEADNLVQDVCERVLSHRAPLRDQARLDAWMYGIMRNSWLDRARYRRVPRDEDLSAANAVANDNGQRTAETRTTLQAVREALGSMSEEHRSVLVLVCVDGLKYREAAQVLGIPLGTVMSRLARARQEIGARIGGLATTNPVTTVPARSLGLEVAGP